MPQNETALIEQRDTDSLALTPARLIMQAAAQGADIDKLATLMDLQLRWEAHEAKKAYVAAMQKFKAEAPDIIKTKKVSFPNRDGKNTTYHHAELHKVSEIVEDSLLRVGIRHSWKTGDVNGRIVVTCVFTHELGHSEEVASLGGPADTSGGKNTIQAIGSTTTYLQRYTLLAGAGIVPEGLDDDGKTEGMPENAITDYCIQMQDDTELEILKTHFRDAFTATKQFNDISAQERIVRVYNERKKELRK